VRLSGEEQMATRLRDLSYRLGVEASYINNQYTQTP